MKVRDGRRGDSDCTFCIIRTWSQEFRIHQIKVNTPTPFLVFLDTEGRQSSLRQNIDVKINTAKSLIPMYCSGGRERKQAMKTNEMQSSSQTFYIYIILLLLEIHLTHSINVKQVWREASKKQYLVSYRYL